MLRKGSDNEETKVTIANLNPNPILFAKSTHTYDYQRDINNNLKCHNNFTNENSTFINRNSNKNKVGVSNKNSALINKS